MAPVTGTDPVDLSFSWALRWLPGRGAGGGTVGILPLVLPHWSWPRTLMPRIQSFASRLLILWAPSHWPVLCGHRRNFWPTQHNCHLSKQRLLWGAIQGSAPVFAEWPFYEIEIANVSSLEDSAEELQSYRIVNFEQGLLTRAFVLTSRWQKVNLGRSAGFQLLGMGLLSGFKSTNPILMRELQGLNILQGYLAEKSESESPPTSLQSEEEVWWVHERNGGFRFHYGGVPGSGPCTTWCLCHRFGEQCRELSVNMDLETWGRLHRSPLLLRHAGALRDDLIIYRIFDLYAT